MVHSERNRKLEVGNIRGKHHPVKFDSVEEKMSEKCLLGKI